MIESVAHFVPTAENARMVIDGNILDMATGGPRNFISRLDHVHLAMPGGEEDQARSFYRDVLGLQEVAKPPELAMRGEVSFRIGSLSLHLGVEAEFRPAKKAHPAPKVH